MALRQALHPRIRRLTRMEKACPFTSRSGPWGDVARMWEAMVNAELWDEHEERIFPMKRSSISQRIKDAVVRLGLEGKYGSHSLRIGMGS